MLQHRGEVGEPEPGVHGRAALGSAEGEGGGREKEGRGRKKNEKERKREKEKEKKGRERKKERKREMCRRRSWRTVARGRQAAERHEMRRRRGKRGRVQAVEKRKDGTTIEIGCQDSGNSGRGLGFRVN